MSRPKGYKLSDEQKLRIGKGRALALAASSHQTQEYYRSKIRTGMILSTVKVGFANVGHDVCSL